MKKIPENVVIILKAVLPFIAIVVLFVILGRIGVDKISETRQKITDVQSEQLALIQKLEMLRTVTAGGMADANFVISALPDSNPSLLVISQLRSLADKDGVSLKSIKSINTGGEGTEYNSVQINFLVLGNKESISLFLNDIKSIAPICTLASARMTELDSNFVSNVTVKTFWAPLPTRLPASIFEYEDLSADEKQILSNISALSQPKFVSLPPASAGGRNNPFGQ
jgi:hypothetical protein